MTYRATSPGGLLCLQCQLRLLRLPRLSRPHRPRRLSTAFSPFSFTSATSPTPPFLASRYKHNAYLAGRNMPGAACFYRASLPYRTADSLGSTATAVSSPPESSSDAPESAAAQEADSTTDATWNVLLDEAGDAADADIFRNIDELRPTEETIVNLSQFQRLASTLTDGFTTSQLHAYIQAHQASPASSEPDRYPWQVRRAPWVPVSATMKDLVGRSGGAHEPWEEADKPESLAKTTAPSWLLQGYVTPATTQKGRMALLLLRECWGLSVRELMDTPGWLDVTVRQAEFELLVLGAPTWLGRIAQAMRATTAVRHSLAPLLTYASYAKSRHGRSLTQQNYVELVPSRRVLRICAPSAISDAILRAIHSVLSHAATKSFLLSEVVDPGAHANSVDAHTLQTLTRLTGSWVRFAKEGETEHRDGLGQDHENRGENAHASKVEQRVLVSYISATPPSNDSSIQGISSSGLEDAGDQVYRLLLASFGPSALPYPSILDYQSTAKTKARFLLDFDATSAEKQPWSVHGNAKSNWARLVAPTLAVDENEETKQMQEQKQKQKPEVLAPTPRRCLPFELGASSSETGEQKWYEVPQTSTVATFGHVLFSRPVKRGKSKQSGSLSILSAPDKKKEVYASSLKHRSRAFLPVMPPLSGIHLPTNESATTMTSSPSSLVLRFLPRIRIGSTGSSPLAAQAPHLEVILDSTATAAQQKPVVLAIRAIVAAHTSDVIFPARPVDVRLTQKRFFELRGDGLAEESSALFVTPLLSFLEQSVVHQMSVAEAPRLQTPLVLPGIRLPTEVLLSSSASPSPSVSRKKKSKKKLSEAPTIETTELVDYVFAGLEARQQVSTSWEDWTVALTHVDGGLGGGRRTELTLEAHNKESREAFCDAVTRLIYVDDVIQWLLP